MNQFAQLFGLTGGMAQGSPFGQAIPMTDQERSAFASISRNLHQQQQQPRRPIVKYVISYLIGGERRYVVRFTQQAMIDYSTLSINEAGKFTLAQAAHEVQRRAAELQSHFYTQLDITPVREITRTTTTWEPVL